MKLTLLKVIGSFGVLLDWKRFIPDHVEIQIEDEGILSVGKRSYSVSDGKVRFPEYELVPGPNKVTFTSKAGVTYDCGCINKSGRFINVINPVDKLSVENALAYESLAERVIKLEEEVRIIKEEYGISII